MGSALSWLAIRGKSPEAIHAELGLHDTGKREEEPESGITGTELPGGWYLILENHRWSYAFQKDLVLSALSKECEIVTCSVEEHVMVSDASGWKDGVKLWSIAHDCRKKEGIWHLETWGTMPPEFAGIRAGREASQREEDAGEQSCDYIRNIPVDLAEALAGYTHEGEMPGGGGARCAVLARLKKNSWLKRLFGR
jgi:hypothetical protein